MDKMKATPLIYGYSWVGLLNILLFQWFFVRLQVSTESKEDRTILGWNFIGLIVPLTGWFSDYWWVCKLSE